VDLFFNITHLLLLTWSTPVKVSWLICSEQALAMIADIRAAFNELLNEVPWIDDSTRTVAREKVIRAFSVNSSIVSHYQI
jgi:hypothetical protein